MKYLHVYTQSPYNNFPPQVASWENGLRGIHHIDFLDYKYRLEDVVVPQGEASHLKGSPNSWLSTSSGFKRALLNFYRLFCLEPCTPTLVPKE